MAGQLRRNTHRDFTAYLAQCISGSPFARIWLFETTFAKVVAHYP
jgi:hypothetical protein